MKMKGSSFAHLLLLCISLDDTNGMSVSSKTSLNAESMTASRRAFLSSSAAAGFASIVGFPKVSNARYALNEETGEYDEVSDEDWQTTWNKRIEKAKLMSSDEIFLAAQGAGNVNLKDGEESEASKKRRALAGCRNGAMREKSGMKDEKQCTARVIGGDYKFMVEAL
ncbi:hypothetical protein ACHAXN_009865 [Cyclotella atomus]